jgi:hypothetical protein
VSRTVRVSAGNGGFSIERARSVLPPRGVSPAPRSALAHGVGDLSDAAAERDVIVLDLVSVEQLHREALAADLRPAPTCTIEATDDYVASTVVMLHA